MGLGSTNQSSISYSVILILLIFLMLVEIDLTFNVFCDAKCLDETALPPPDHFKWGELSYL